MTAKELLRNDIENADELLTLAGVMHRRAARLGKVIDYATNKNSICIESVLKLTRMQAMYQTISTVLEMTLLDAFDKENVMEALLSELETTYDVERIFKTLRSL